MSKDRDAVRLAAKLYECHEAARSLLGAHFKRDMALYATAIKGVAAADKCTEIAAAQKMAREAGGFGAIVVLAAYVEMVEPTETHPAEGGATAATAAKGTTT